MILSYQGEKQWRGLDYIMYIVVVLFDSDCSALHFPETCNWQWRGKQHSVSTVLIIKGPPFNIQGGGGWANIFVADKLIISTRLGGALIFSKFYHMFIMFIYNIIVEQKLEFVRKYSSPPPPPTWNLNGAHLMLW